MTIPKITGPEMLRAIQERTKGQPCGSFLKISLLDSIDLLKLNAVDLVSQFHFAEDVAATVDADLLQGRLTELSKAIGINLVVDKKQTDSLIKNAGIIRSAGALADEPETLEETLEFFNRLRHDHRPV